MREWDRPQYAPVWTAIGPQHVSEIDHPASQAEVAKSRNTKLEVQVRDGRGTFAATAPESLQ